MANDPNSLDDKLARLAGDEDIRADGSRVIASGPDGLAAVLTEIDDTVLTAALTFAVAEHELTLIAGSRRLLDIEAASDNLGLSKDLMGRALAPEDGLAIDAICEGLDRFCAADGEVTVRSAPADRPGTEADGGISVQILSEALGLSAPDLEGDTPFEKFVTGTVDHVDALIVLEDGVVARTDGDDEIVATLTSVLEDQLVEFDKARFDAAHEHFDPSLTFLPDTLAAETGVALAISEHQMILFAFKSEGLADMHKLWRLLH